MRYRDIRNPLLDVQQGGRERVLDDQNRAACVLAPAVVEDVLDGTLRADVGAAALIRTGAIPERWSEQSERYLAAR